MSLSLPVLVSLITTTAFGLFAILFSRKEEKNRQLLATRELKYKQRAYEIAVLKEIQDRVGYALDVTTITDIITGSLKNLFPYSVASSLLIAENRLVFKAYIEETVDHAFIDQVRKNMVKALSSFAEKELPLSIHESLSGVMLNDAHVKKINSTVSIPFRINKEVVAVINVSSSRDNVYTEDQIGVLYQITTQASHALVKLQSLLIQEKGKLMATIASLTDGVFVVANSQEMFIINDAARSLLNLSAKEPSFSDISASLSGYTDFSEVIKKAMHGAKIEPKVITVGDKTVRVVLSPVKNTLHETDPSMPHTTLPLGIAVVVHDITLEKQIEEMKKDFTNMVVHDLRAPLTSVKNAAKMLAVGDGKFTEEERTNLLSLMETQTENLLNQVSSILDAAKLEEGRLTMNKVVGDFGKVATEALSIFIPQAATKHITLQNNISTDLPEFSFDAGYMGEVLMNLLSNSIKFTGENGMVTLDVHVEGESLKAIVSDTGIGIPKEKQPTLFTRFTQVDQNKPEDHLHHSGTGLGLYIVKGIVEAHGGTITLESEENKGTSITITLPLKQGDEKPLGDTPRASVLHS